jgi:hypothetical protein
MKLSSTILMLAGSLSLATAVSITASTLDVNPALERREVGRYATEYMIWHKLYEKKRAELDGIRKRHESLTLAEIEAHPCYSIDEEQCYALWKEAFDAKNTACLAQGEGYDADQLKELSDNCAVFDMRQNCLLHLECTAEEKQPGCWTNWTRFGSHYIA